MALYILVCVVILRQNDSEVLVRLRKPNKLQHKSHGIFTHGSFIQI